MSKLDDLIYERSKLQKAQHELQSLKNMIYNHHMHSIGFTTGVSFASFGYSVSDKVRDLMMAEITERIADLATEIAATEKKFADI